MKRSKVLKSAIIASLVLAGFFSLPGEAEATKWVPTYAEDVGGCVIQHYSCQRRFLSTDGCDVHDTEARFNISDPDCQEMLEDRYDAFK